MGKKESDILISLIVDIIEWLEDLDATLTQCYGASANRLDKRKKILKSVLLKTEELEGCLKKKNSPFTGHE